MNLQRIGFIVSLIVLVATLIALLWPWLADAYFWTVAGLVLGIMGTFFFGISLLKPRIDDHGKEAQDEV